MTDVRLQGLEAVISKRERVETAGNLFLNTSLSHGVFSTGPVPRSLFTKVRLRLFKKEILLKKAGSAASATLNKSYAMAEK